MMKKLLLILVLGLFLSGNVNATMWTSKDTKSMHEYLAQGWQLTFSNSFPLRNGDDFHVFVLQKGIKVIYCRIERAVYEKCYKPK